MARLSLLLALGILVACGGGSTEGLATPGVTTALERAAATPVQSAKAEINSTPPVGGPTPEKLDTPIAAVTSEGGTSSAAPPNSGDAAQVIVGGKSFIVELADTPARRAQGLSGHPPLAAGTGVLFVFEEERRHSFWMKGMLFSIDILWIDSQCVLADITEDAPQPEPDQDSRDLPTFAPVAPVKYVLEVNAGTAQQNGLDRGDKVTFTGALAGRFGC